MPFLILYNMSQRKKHTQCKGSILNFWSSSSLILERWGGGGLWVTEKVGFPQPLWSNGKTISFLPDLATNLKPEIQGWKKTQGSSSPTSIFVCNSDIMRAVWHHIATAWLTNLCRICWPKGCQGEARDPKSQEGNFFRLWWTTDIVLLGPGLAIALEPYSMPPFCLWLTVRNLLRQIVLSSGTEEGLLCVQPHNSMSGRIICGAGWEIRS